MGSNNENWIFEMVAEEIHKARNTKVNAVSIDTELPLFRKTNVYLDFTHQRSTPQNHVDSVQFKPDGTEVQKLRVQGAVHWFLNTGRAQRAEDLMEYFAKRHEGHDVHADGMHAVGCRTCCVSYQPNWATGTIEPLYGDTGFSIRSPDDKRLQWGVPDYRVSIYEQEWSAAICLAGGRTIAEGKLPLGTTEEEAEEEALLGVFFTYINGLPY
jgi:hypothetical protein